MEKEPPKGDPLVSSESNVDNYVCDVCGTEAGPIDPDVEIDCSTPELVKELMKGLDSDTAEQRLASYGPNAIPQKVVRWYTILLKQLTSSMAVMIEIAMVLAAAVQEWEDFAIIGVLLTINATIGFYEEYEAMMKVEGIKSALSPMTVVKRNGEFVKMPTSTLVPGDVIFLRGGDSVPADLDWLDGDPMAVDTAALTGEPFPRKYPDSKGNKRLMSGCMVVSGNSYLLVQRTGIYTEMGSATLLMQQSTKPTQSVFEKSIIEVCELVMAVAVLFLVAVFLVELNRGEETITILTDCLAILIASVPVALPVVMQVTLALGAGEMAKQQAIVTHLTAMQEIASMTMLCSDKTGTLTTAKIQVFFDQIWTTAGFDKGQILQWAAVASNPHADDDPIDVAMLRSYRDTFSTDYDERIKRFNVTKFVGFTPEVKRTVAYATHDEEGDIKVSKGLLDKILSTGDDGGDMWDCVNADEVRAEVEEIDQAMSLKGYKTLGVAFGKKNARGQWVMKFAGIVPMLDPPRDDTKWVVEQIKQCGIQIKMITGDHQNIAAETARLIGLGDNILHREKLSMRECDEKDQMIKEAHGFAQVMPRDKNDVVRTLQALNYIVGMTGDGVNDAPALKQAHIGIAVEGSTDAARSAADIILTTEGLAPIFTAVLESRKIFQRVNSYVLYRISATIQIVLVLSLLIFTVNQTIKALYIILLALFNDLTMITISYDNVVPSRSPDQPTINRLLRISTVFGVLMTIESLLFYFFGSLVLSSSSRFRHSNGYTEALMYLQISLAIESLIFVTRMPEAPFYSSRPIPSLLLSVIVANVGVTLIVTTGILGPKISPEDAAVVWVYDMVWFLIIDLLKIPLTMTIENFFPPEESNIGVRTAESTAAHSPTDAPHTLALPNIDAGYSLLRDTGSAIAGAVNTTLCRADTATRENVQPVTVDSSGVTTKGSDVV